MRAVRLRWLLATTSLVGAAGALGLADLQPAFAVSVCSISDSGVTTGPVTNTSSAPINCIAIVNSTVNGNVTNPSVGTINAGTSPGTQTGILITNSSTINGAVINNGSITTPSGAGIAVENNAVVSGGVTNTGIITHGSSYGITVNAVSTFGGGITNTGTVTGGFYGIYLNSISTFSGGIVNTGKFIATNASGIYMANVGTLQGGVHNSGIIASTQDTGINFNGVSVLTGGITNSGTISGGQALELDTITTFYGGILNTGLIVGRNAGIGFFGGATFSGGIVNHGTITGGTETGILVRGVATFIGGITNTGIISGQESGIVATGGGAISIFDSGIIIGGGGVDESGNSGTAVDLSGNSPGNTFTLGPGYSITGTVLGQGADTFQLGGTGNGVFNLSTIGTSSAAQYQGFTTFNVVSGVWTTTGVFAQSQAWNVLGGTLAGTGTLRSVNVNNGGTLEPGTPGVPGTFMTVNGSLAFQSGATYLVNISPTAASRANVSGAVTLNGAVEGVLMPGSYSSKTTYDILDPTSISGTFSSFTVNVPGFAGTLTYNDNTDVLLNLTAQIGSGGGLSPNQQSVANAINTYFNSGGTLPASFFPVFGLSGGALGNALTQLDGEDTTGAERGAFDLMNEFLGLMLDPFVDGRGGLSTGGGALGFAPDQQGNVPPDLALAYAGLLKAPPAPTFQQRWSTWAAGFGGSATTNGDPAVGSNNVTTSTYGYAAGLDYHYSPDTVFGFSLAGGGTNWNLANALGTGRGDAVLAGLYGVTHNGPWYLGSALAFANNWFTTNRTAFAGDQLTASFQGQSYAARLEGGYRFALPAAYNAVGITPYAAVQVQDFRTPTFSETDLTGGGFGLSYNAQNGTDTRSELGSRFDDLTALNNLPLILRAKVAWAHDWVSDPALNASFESLPGTGFTVFGAPIPHDSALTSAGAQLFFTPNWSLTAKFDGEFASGYGLYAGTGTLRHTW